jgi:hypothetical protein
MKMVVGYDRDLARVCFKRNLTQLIRPGAGASDISRGEIDYVSDWLADSSVFGNYRKLGTTWSACSWDELIALAKMAPHRLSRSQAWQIETAANNILTIVGLIQRAGATERTIQAERTEADQLRTVMAMRLYLRAAQSRFPNSDQRSVLARMALNTPDWIQYLSYLPGNDYLDLLAADPPSPFSA